MTTQFWKDFWKLLDEYIRCETEDEDEEITNESYQKMRKFVEVNQSSNPSKEELLNWIIDAHITIRWDSPMVWIKEDGTRFNANWSIESPVAQFTTYQTFEETLEKAYESWKQHKEYRG